MNLPAFTATASLYQSQGHYAGANSGYFQTPGIVPSATNQCVETCLQTCMTQKGSYERCSHDCQAHCQAPAPTVKKMSG